MNRKVSLKEIVGTNIVYAIILIFLYWMWARADWKGWYSTAQFALVGGLVAFFLFQAMRIKKYKKEGVDEMAERNLMRCDSFCLKLFVAVMIVVAFGCAILSVKMITIGWIIVLSILALSIIRTVLFVIIDSKGV